MHGKFQNGSYNPYLVDSDTIDIHWAFKVKFERQAICHKPYGHIIQIAYFKLECLCMQKCLFEHKIDHFCFISYSFDLLWTAQIQKWSQNLITIYGNKTTCTKETQGLWTFPNAFVKISDFKPFC